MRILLLISCQFMLAKISYILNLRNIFDAPFFCQRICVMFVLKWFESNYTSFRGPSSLSLAFSISRHRLTFADEN